MKKLQLLCFTAALTISTAALAQTYKPQGLTPEQQKALEMMSDPAFQEKMRQQQLQGMSKEQMQQMQKYAPQPQDMAAMKQTSLDPALQEKLSKATPAPCDGCKVVSETLMNIESMMDNVPAAMKAYQPKMPKVESKYPKVMYSKVFQDASGKTIGLTAVFPGGGLERYSQMMAVNNPYVRQSAQDAKLPTVPQSPEDFEKNIDEYLATGEKSSVRGFDAYTFETKEQQEKYLKSKNMSFAKPMVPGAPQTAQASSTIMILQKPDTVRIYFNYPEEKQGKKLFDWASQLDLTTYEGVFEELKKK